MKNKITNQEFEKQVVEMTTKMSKAISNNNGYAVSIAISNIMKEFCFCCEAINAKTGKNAQAEETLKVLIALTKDAIKETMKAKKENMCHKTKISCKFCGKKTVYTHIDADSFHCVSCNDEFGQVTRKNYNKW